MSVSVVTLAKKTWQEYGDDNISRLAAALAYYTFTSFFPLLLVLIAIIGIALSFNIGAAEDARTFVINSVSGTIPTARDLLAQSIQETEENRWTLGLAGLLTGLWAASNYDELLNPDLVCPETDEDSALCSDEMVENQASITKEDQMLILPPAKPHSSEASSEMRFLSHIMALFMSLPFILKSILKTATSKIPKNVV